MKIERLLLFFLLALSCQAFAQTKVKGKVSDPSTGETLIGAAVVLEGTTTGTTTDLDGKFSFEVVQDPPFNLVISFIGYEPQTIVFNAEGQKLDIKMKPSAAMLDAVEVVDFRVSEKQRQEPLTVERMDILAIKETPADNFYDGLAMMKGVDLTSASLGFKVINTRGFNSTSPVRSLQLIDGVDNQSPGLNFSLGNFLGSSDLDIMRVDIIAGASSAFYGPGAFNGVINMTTKNPFLFKGLSASVKYGERNMQEYAFRWAQVLKNKDGKDKFAYKMNFFYMRALDWYAENYNAIDSGLAPTGNPGGFDAVNTYGDEDNFDYQDPAYGFPGLGVIHKDVYRETDLADYNTNNLKANMGLYYKLTDSIEVSYNINYSTGTTVYQGDNRYSLKGIQFLQNKVQIGKEGKWFVRAYATHEDAGQSYDLVTTGIRMEEATRVSDVNGNDQWFKEYSRYWNRNFVSSVEGLEGYPDIDQFNSESEWGEALDDFLLANQDSLTFWHAQTREALLSNNRAGLPPFEPGSAAYDSAFADITSRKFTDNGSLFFDRSALYHIQGEYQFNIDKFKFVVGANGRLYTPNSQGTIFQDTLTYKREMIDSVMTITDSSYATVRNMEFGAYMGVSRSFLENKLQTNFTLRVDKNQNFNFLLSPALSAVYSPSINHTFRTTFSSAIRNPTLADQYLYYNVGRAILLGNLNGYDSLLTVPSIIDYLAELDANQLDYFSVDAIRPERVRTIEGGYRGIFKEKVYVDITAYKSWYTDFIGYLIGVETSFASGIGGGLPVSPQVYRVAANATSTVQTQGVTIGFNYFYAKKHALNGNYSYNELTSGEDDPIIPAFNTPKNKFNIGISGRGIITPFLSFGKWGYSINYRWVQGFTFEGSPQFTGEIASYGMLNAQVNYSVSKWHSTVKIGASNVLDNRVYQVYGGPQIGRLAYISLVFDWNKT
jgi:iron complex outermembrane receptor protein